MHQVFEPNLREQFFNDIRQKLGSLYGLLSCLMCFGGQMIDDFYADLIKLAQKLVDPSRFESILSVSLMVS